MQRSAKPSKPKWPTKHRLLYRSLGHRIRNLRTECGITQEDLAHAVHLTRTSLTNIEGGRQKLLIHTLVDIATALKVSPAEILHDHPTKRTKATTNA